MTIYLILKSVLCLLRPWFKNKLSNLIFIVYTKLIKKLSCLKKEIITLINIFLKIFTKIFVQEQRVDGSWGLEKYVVKKIFQQNSIPLRYTLMGFERNYQINVPSKQIIKYTYSTLSLNSKLNPWMITGLADSEGSFIISLQSNDNSKTKWKVKPSFSLALHKKDIAIIENLKNSLGIGKIRIKDDRNQVEFVVESFTELLVIIEHFDMYPLVTGKSSDYILFKECFKIIQNKEHLTLEGIEKIISFKSSLNWGLSDKLKEAFPNIIATPRPEFIFKNIPDPFWVSGFTSGDGSFNIVTRPSKNKIGFRVELNYSFFLHIREKEVIIGLADFFGVKFPKESDNTEITYKYIFISDKSVQIKISNFSDIEYKIIPFFNKYPLEGTKQLDFEDYKEAFEIIKNKEHLTHEGFKKILAIKARMNDNRNN